MRYVGKLTNGKVFDQCTSGKPFYFKLGKGEVIKGWDEGVKGMKVGAERRLTCPAKLAYGSQKLPGIRPTRRLCLMSSSSRSSETVSLVISILLHSHFRCARVVWVLNLE